MNMNQGLIKVGLKFVAYVGEQVESLNAISKIQKRQLKRISNNSVKKQIGGKISQTTTAILN